MRWRDKDWIWLVGCLVVIIILLIAGFYNDDVVALNFSIISSAVSIALASVAIFIALNQSNDNNRLSEDMRITMNLLDEKLSNVGEKVNKIDADFLYKVFSQRMENVSEEITDSIHEKGEISNEELMKLYSAQIEQVRLEMQALLEKESKERIKNYEFGVWRQGDQAHHKKWGFGTVKEAKGHGDETELVIMFPEPYGEKRILARYAPITRVL